MPRPFLQTSEHPNLNSLSFGRVRPGVLLPTILAVSRLSAITALDFSCVKTRASRREFSFGVAFSATVGRVTSDGRGSRTLDLSARPLSN